MNEEVRIKINNIIPEGFLAVPDDASGIVVFAQGSGSSRFLPRNTFVTKELQEAGVGTMLTDLLTEKKMQHIKDALILIFSRIVLKKLSLGS